MVWYTSHACPEIEAGSPGATRETAITLEDFGDLYDAATEPADEDSAELPPPSEYECRWVRISGFLEWMNYYHYRATLTPSAWASYGANGRVRYIVERFDDTAPPRSQLVRRQVTLVGRFYDLCAAAARERANDDDDWIMLFGPCHYGGDQGLMLDEVHVEAVHDDAPRYILGERNRSLFAELPRADGAERAALIERTRAWGALLKQGVTAYADAHFAAHPILATRPEEEQRDTRDWLESPDGYIAYASARLARVNVRRAPVEVFWNQRYAGDRDEAVGCICLAGSCTETWPLTLRDAERFVGDAVCTELDLQRDGTWLW